MLVTLEGLDGSGKSTVATALEEAFPDAIHTSEPTNSWYGDAVRHSLEDPSADSLAELFLYTADHAAHLSNIVLPALDQDELVISDRFSDSRYAYQAVSLTGILDDPLAFVQDVHEPWTRVPDLTVYLDIDAQTGVMRSGASSKFEHEEFLAAVRANYEQLITANPDRFVRIDGTQEQSVVISRVVETVTNAQSGSS